MAKRRNEKGAAAAPAAGKTASVKTAKKVVKKVPAKKSASAKTVKKEEVKAVPAKKSAAAKPEKKSAPVKKAAPAKKAAAKKSVPVKSAKPSKKYVYLFGKGISEGRADMKELLGGKGANLAEMANLNLPVPAGFTITTECCVDYFRANAIPESLEAEVLAALKKVEENMGMKFGSTTNPLLVSCRSGARSSMPGMMETVLNVGLSSKTLPGLIKKTKHDRLV